MADMTGMLTKDEIRRIETQRTEMTRYKLTN